MNRNADRQILEATFPGKGLHKPRVLERAQEVQGDAASLIDPTGCENFQRDCPLPIDSSSLKEREVLP